MYDPTPIDPYAVAAFCAYLFAAVVLSWHNANRARRHKRAARRHRDAALVHLNAASRAAADALDSYVRAGLAAANAKGFAQDAARSAEPTLLPLRREAPAPRLRLYRDDATDTPAG